MENSIKRLAEVQTILKLTYGIIPIVAGADKFTNLLTNWADYLNPMLASILPFSSHTFMMIVGVIEIVAGILVLISPQKGAYVVCAWLVAIALSLLARCAWLVAIALSLLASGNFLDVAVRDLVMAIGAWSLAKISKIVHSPSFS